MAWGDRECQHSYVPPPEAEPEPAGPTDRTLTPPQPQTLGNKHSLEPTDGLALAGWVRR